MVNYGSGPALDEDFDFAVDTSSGDIRTTDSPNELRKDLVWYIASAVEYGRGIDSPANLSNGIAGVRIDRDTIRDVEIVLSAIVTDDPRVETVDRIDLEFENNRMTIDMTVIAVDDVLDFEFVVSV